jgi:DNA-binding transcriptional LysR family regulator
MMVMICAPRYKLAKAKKVSAAEIAAEPFISREPGSGTREVADQYFQQNGVSQDAINVVMELGSPEAIKGVVETGLGVSILSRATVAKELKLGVLVAVPLNPPLTRGLSVVTPKDRFRSRLLATFVEFAKGRMKDLAAAQ